MVKLYCEGVDELNLNLWSLMPLWYIMGDKRSYSFSVIPVLCFKALSFYLAYEVACSCLFCETSFFIMAGSNSKAGQKQLLHKVVLCDKLNVGF